MGEIRKVFIESMAFKGYGVARADGRVVFVPYSVTGDEALIEIVEEKKNYALGRLKMILCPSHRRTDPQCPYFEVCGGCQWQHIEDIEQAAIKKDILQNILRRLGGMKEVSPLSTVPAPQSYSYRARVQLKVVGKDLGFYQAGSHRIVDIDHCPISHPLINRIISILREERSSLSSLQEIEIRVSPDEGKGVLILRSLSLQEKTRDFVKELLRCHSILKGISISGREGSLSFGQPSLTFTVFFDHEEETRTLKLRASPDSFFQVNLEQNRALIRTVLQFGNLTEAERILDLYAGIGNFSLPLSPGAGEVIGVEENKAAVEDARFNAKENRIDQCEFLQGKVKAVLSHWKKGNPDLVILDPPRTGGKKIVSLVVELAPKRVVYVSCDPATLSRDLRLCAEKGYRPRGLSLIDMFPQTYHMEVVALLKPQDYGEEET